MKRIIKISLTALAYISVSGCGPKMIAVEDASSFVEEAFKTAMADVAKKKQRPSLIALSFYADSNVNATVKQQKPHLIKTPAQANQPPSEFIKYSLKCERTLSVTFTDCQTLNAVSSGDSKNVPQLRFKQIQQRQNSRLSISVEYTPPVAGSPKAEQEYFLKCDRTVASVYKQCRSLIEPSSADPKTSPVFSIKQVQLMPDDAFEVLVERQVGEPRKRVTYRAPKKPKTRWVESYVDPKPISFKVVMLRDNSLLLSADKESLNADLEDTLGKNYIDHDDYVLTPGQFKFVNFTRVDSDTHYIGVIADYRDGTRAVWKKALKIEPTGNVYPLHIHFKRKEVDILTED